MADLNEQTWKFGSPQSDSLLHHRYLPARRFAQRAEKEFQVTLGEKGPTFRDIDFQLAQYLSSSFCMDIP